ncbi:MAG: DUF4349 domain-containing protein [Candidatus Geothermarchaeales archaeon]
MLQRVKRVRPRKTPLLIAAAFALGILVSAFMAGITLYGETAHPTGRSWEKEPDLYLASVETRGDVSEVFKPQTSWVLESSPPSALEVAGRMTIYTATLSLEVGDVDEAIAQIQGVVEAVGGYVSHVTTSRRGEQRVGAMTVRVPQVDFYDVIAHVEGLGDSKDKSVRGEDVTEQYIDLEARLRNARRQEERLLSILERAETVDEILRVEGELMRVREQVERLTGQMSYLERRVEYATITVTLSEPEPSRPWVEVPEVDWGRAVERGLWGVFLVAQALITLFIVLTPLAAVGAPVYYLYRRRQARPEA